MKTFSILYWYKVMQKERCDHVRVQAETTEQAYDLAEASLNEQGIEFTTIGCAYEVKPSAFEIKAPPMKDLFECLNPKI